MLPLQLSLLLRLRHPPLVRTLTWSSSLPSTILLKVVSLLF